MLLTTRLAAALLVLSSLALAGCQAPLVDTTGPLAIQSVSVSTKPDVKTATDLATALQTEVAKKVVGYEAGTPASLAISIEQVTYKDPVLSLLVGSSNSLSAKVSVLDDKGGALATFDHRTMLDAQINGIIGATIAATQNRTTVDEDLAETSARQLRDRIYGPKGYKPKKAAVAAPAAPAAAPAAPAATPAPKPADKPVKETAPVS